MRIVRKISEIEQLLIDIKAEIYVGKSKRKHFTYEQGVRDTLDWLLGESDKSPIPISGNYRAS